MCFLILGRSVGWKKKKITRSLRISILETPASLPRSLETTRHGHQIDINSIWPKIWWLIVITYKQNGYTTDTSMPGKAVIMLMFQIKRIIIHSKYFPNSDWLKHSPRIIHHNSYWWPNLEEFSVYRGNDVKNAGRYRLMHR